MLLFLASILPWAAGFAPRDFAFCSGQILAISQNSALFALLGDIYGGDARSTFGLPDLRGRTPIGNFTGPGLPAYQLGWKIGTPTHVMSLGQLSEHTHTATVSGGGGDVTGTIRVTSEPPASNTTDPADAYLGICSSKAPIYNRTLSGNATLASDALSLSGGGGIGSVVIGDTGNSESFSVMQPSIVLNFIICIEGIFPPRN